MKSSEFNLNSRILEMISENCSTGGTYGREFRKLLSSGLLTASDHKRFISGIFSDCGFHKNSEVNSDSVEIMRDHLHKQVSCRVKRIKDAVVWLNNTKKYHSDVIMDPNEMLVMFMFCIDMLYSKASEQEEAFRLAWPDWRERHDDLMTMRWPDHPRLDRIKKIIDMLKSKLLVIT